MFSFVVFYIAYHRDVTCRVIFLTCNGCNGPKTSIKENYIQNGRGGRSIMRKNGITRDWLGGACKTDVNNKKSASLLGRFFTFFGHVPRRTFLYVLV